MTSSPSQSQEPLDRTSRPLTKGKLVPGIAEQKTYSLCATYSQKTREDWFMHIKFPLPDLPICYVTPPLLGRTVWRGKGLPKGCTSWALPCRRMHIRCSILRCERRVWSVSPAFPGKRGQGGTAFLFYHQWKFQCSATNFLGTEKQEEEHSSWPARSSRDSLALAVVFWSLNTGKRCDSGVTLTVMPSWFPQLLCCGTENSHPG